MPDFPSTLGLAAPYRLVVPTIDKRDPNTAAAAGAVYTANDAVFVPFEVDSPRQINQIIFEVTVSSGNIDVGIYSQGGARLASLGSTAMAAAGPQTANIADLTLSRGRYYAAFAISNAVGTIKEITPLGGAAVTPMQMVGARKMATAFPLPATATFAIPTRTTMPLLALEFQ